MYDVRNARKLQFPVFPHVDHEGALTAVAPCLELLDGHFADHFWKTLRPGLQNWKGSGRGAWSSGSIAVSNRPVLVQAFSAVRVTKSASCGRPAPTTMNALPPTDNARAKRSSYSG